MEERPEEVTRSRGLERMPEWAPPLGEFSVEKVCWKRLLATVLSPGSLGVSAEGLRPSWQGAGEQKLLLVIGPIEDGQGLSGHLERSLPRSHF